MDRMISNERALDMFSSYMELSGVPELENEEWGDERLVGKRLGIANGSSWVSLWSIYFGRKYLPGCKLINVGNDAMQYSFMKAHANNEVCPPIVNRETLARYARDIADMYPVDCILATCSTMNRSYSWLCKGIEGTGIPLVQIDTPMMEKAVTSGKEVLVIATHGPTVQSTRMLLEETADKFGKEIEISGATDFEAFELLGKGDIVGHNRSIAETMKKALSKKQFDVVVLAQLSCSVFKLSFPDCEKEFGVPVLTSAECGFERVREILLSK